METAKVDIRKLQLLNDRINQCLDALNQVRLSVHGLSPTPGAFGYQPFGQIPTAGVPGFGLSHTGAFGASPFLPQVGAPVAAQGLGFGPFPFALPVYSGLSHTGPWGSATVPGIHPFASPYGIEGVESYGRPGLMDPFLNSRIAQTFPYAQMPTPPVVALT